MVGTVIVAQHIDDVSRKELQETEEAWQETVASSKVKAFSQVLVSPSARFGYHGLMTTAGLGALAPNTVVLPLWRNDHHDTACSSLSEYVHVMRDAYALGKNVVVACNFEAVVDVEKGWQSLCLFWCRSEQVFKCLNLVLVVPWICSCCLTFLSDLGPNFLVVLWAV